MTLHPLRSSILFLGLLFFAGGVAVAQERSVVFLPEVDRSTNHRPQRKRVVQPRYFAPPKETQSHTGTRTEFENYVVTNFLLADQNEPFIAINPLDPSNLVAGANDYRTDPALWSYTSHDGGKTWVNQELPRKTTLAIATDPSLAFDRLGNVFYANGRFATAGIPERPNEVTVYKSTTKGDTWLNPTHPFADTTSIHGAQALADKYFIAVDHNAESPFKDRVYVAWAEIANGKTRIVSSFSTNGGASWSTRVQVAPPANVTSPIPITAPNGDLYITYIDKSSAKQIMFARSTNGGVSFSTPIKVANYRDLGPVVPPGHVDERPYIKDFIGVNSFPSIAVDHSSKHKGRIYLSWAGTDANDFAHIYVATSTDNGATWSAPKIAEAYTSPIKTDRFFNWIAVDKTNGDVGIVYYDSRLDSIDNRLVDIYFSHSRDGGETYRSRRISSTSFDPHITTATRDVENISFKFFGDYIGVAVLNRHWHAVWTDTRVTPDQDIYTANVRPYRPHGVDNLTVEETGEEFATLRWSFDPQTTFGYPLTNFEFMIKRDDGAITMHASDVREWEDQSVEWLKRYTYTVYVVADGDTSIGRSVRFIPILVRKPKMLEFTASKASSDGFSLTMRIPDKNEYNRDLEGLDSLYVIINNELAEVLPVSDIYKGTIQERIYAQESGRYHLVKAVISTTTEGFRTFSDTTVAWLWAGDPQNDFDNDFESALNIFTPFAWSTTNLEPFTSKVLNDSLPNVNYPAGYNSWFLLPAIRIGELTKTLEFDHIALVSPLDVAIVEASRDNGITFEPVGQFNVNTRDAHWNQTLSQSQLFHELLSLHQYIDSMINIRFRLVASVGGMDGWFVDNIALTDALGVERASPLRSSLYPNPAIAGGTIRLSFELPDAGSVRMKVVDMLGRVLSRRSVPASGKSFDVVLNVDAPGTYVAVVEYDSNNGTLNTMHRFVVLP